MKSHILAIALCLMLGTALASAIQPIQLPTPTTGEVNGHKWVDMGLPSGVKWATHNIGAETAKGHGTHFAWGDTKPGNNDMVAYDKSNYILYDEGITNSEYSPQLAMGYDVAQLDWGGGWRIPTDDEITELINNTDCQPYKLENVSGCLLTSRINGNQIFFPAAGEVVDGLMKYAWNGRDDYHFGVYWSSTPSGYYKAEAALLIVDKAGTSFGRFEASSQNRNERFSIRPVIN